MTKRDENRSGLTDDELLAAARLGDAESLAALAAKCAFIPHRFVQTAAGLGIDRDDLRQEALIALMKALHSYKPGSGAVFTTYAAVCIRRHLLSVLRAGFRQNNLPMVGYLPLDDGSSGTATDPESIIIEAEDFAATREKIFGRLSAFERDMLEMYLSGLSYAEMAEHTGKSEKSVGNALARARRKLRFEAYKGT